MKLTGCLDENVFFFLVVGRVRGDVSVKAKERE